MRVVGLDQSYTGFGYCVDGVSKKKSFPPSKYSSDVQRLKAVEEFLWDWFNRLQVDGPVDMVAMEGYANAAKFGREMAGELGWAVKRTVYLSFGFEPLVIAPNSLKKFVTGSGAGKKNVMLLGVFKKWGETFSDDNQADAFSLEKFGEAYLTGKMHQGDGQARDLTQYEREAVEAVRKGK